MVVEHCRELVLSSRSPRSPSGSCAPFPDGCGAGSPHQQGAVIRGDVIHAGAGPEFVASSARRYVQSAPGASGLTGHREGR